LLYPFNAPWPGFDGIAFYDQDIVQSFGFFLPNGYFMRKLTCTRGFFYTFFLHTNGIAFVTRTDTFIFDIFDSQRRTE